MADSVSVLFFASVRQAVGYGQETLSCEEPGLPTDIFWNRLLERHPALLPFRGSVRLARNCEYMSREDLIKPGDEIALIPPVSGG